jgi:hypothetical protein
MGGRSNAHGRRTFGTGSSQLLSTTICPNLQFFQAQELLSLWAAFIVQGTFNQGYKHAEIPLLTPLAKIIRNYYLKMNPKSTVYRTSEHPVTGLIGA